MPADTPRTDAASPNAADLEQALLGDRKLDARVSAEVMGRPPLEHEGDYVALRECVCEGRSGLRKKWAGHWFACVEPLPRYSVRMDDAWRVVQVMAKRVGGAPWRLEKREDAWVTVAPDGRELASAPSAPLCICRAALAVLGHGGSAGA